MTMKITVKNEGPNEYLAMVTRGTEKHTLQAGRSVELTCWPGAAISIQEASATTSQVVDAEPLLRWFAYEHLPGNLKAISTYYYELARNLVLAVPASAERTIALRKLLESKDAAVRAAIL